MNLLEHHKCICKQCKISSKESNPTGYGKETVFQLKNVKNKIVDKYIVDDCLLINYQREEKCDYLFRINEDEIIYLVECKGSDVMKAVSQIESSLKILKDSVEEYIIKGRIVSTKVYSPDIRDRNYTRLREKLKGELVVKNKIIEENI